MADTDIQEQNVETQGTNDSPYFKNAPVILEVCKKEYESERARTNTIDFKVSIITAIVMAALALVIKVVDFENLQIINPQDTKVLIGLLLKLVTGASSFVLLLIALFILLFAIVTRDYKFIDCEAYLDRESLLVEEDAYQIVLANKFNECLKNNVEVNGKRCKLYNRSIRFLLIGLAFMAGFIILKIVL